jgi:hypothetical protein
MRWGLYDGVGYMALGMMMLAGAMAIFVGGVSHNWSKITEGDFIPILAVGGFSLVPAFIGVLAFCNAFVEDLYGPKLLTVDRTAKKVFRRDQFVCMIAELRLTYQGGQGTIQGQWGPTTFDYYVLEVSVQGNPQMSGMIGRLCFKNEAEAKRSGEELTQLLGLQRDQLKR